MKRAFLIHGWEGNPDNCWFPWLKKELEKLNYEVHIPVMPNPDEPEIEAWVSTLKQEVQTPDEATIFIGHSIGCQAILRYLETINEKVGKIILVAPWVHLTERGTPDDESKAIAKPWIETPINWEKIKANEFIAIFSDDDPYIPLDDSKIFKEKLNAKIIMEHGEGHFDELNNTTELPIILKEISHFL